MAPPASVSITQLLKEQSGEPGSRDRLLSAVYDELRAMAKRQLRRERSGHTLQATALVHEAYLKLVGSTAMSWKDRAHFFGACANAMRQILVEHARSRTAQKRGRGVKPESLTDKHVAGTGDLELVLSVNECLERLRSEDARATQIVELRYFAGLEIKDIAEILQMTERTVHRDWAFARVKLLQMFGRSLDSGVHPR
jgi:RNA polymerase sigma factor (TIGR02999 family)